ncbi:MAG: CcoQ/FixQ family Cbb3-type cytochrome c oxidase assembly chaperone [Chitinophagales bacterium]|nr:CcoQ/FixQ family Cbb3-type cytochrome c oxidase assembly chaperone [Chitinophagales bacterium]HNK12795.1 CcoQ/FixQ family Cbb3-type cytochrome c oxidase assembly chaperone [Chitinophagales bacterium]HNL58469.1 CcoQ/FixQ family Cbb3-type cytochrome c oxidase assembly chaperone [Chitinophagales bacterium]HRG36045.1 CcoQ/FixQ family Cbb3-type cytochrome c oxidase assembly chaperone [Chitinophagales bacterium]
MKFINYLEGITGVSVFPMTSLLLFVIFFIGVMVWVMRADTGFINHMRNIPLENDINETNK